MGCIPIYRPTCQRQCWTALLSNPGYRVRRPLIALLLLAFPLIEIAGFVIVGRQIGVLATVGLVIATSVLGTILLRFQGFGVLARIGKDMQTGKNPGRDIAHGVMILVAGFLLLLPGFVSDIIGLLLFIPPIRDLGWQFVRSRINLAGGVTVFSRGFPGGARRRPDNTIDLDAGDYTTSRPSPKPQPRIDEER